MQSFISKGLQDICIQCFFPLGLSNYLLFSFILLRICKNRVYVVICWLLSISVIVLRTLKQCKPLHTI